MSYATVTWNVEDVQGIAVMTRKRAEDWLENNAKYIQEAMVIRGWEAIETLLSQDGHLVTQLRVDH